MNYHKDKAKKNENGMWIDKKGQELNPNHTADIRAKLTTSRIALQIKASHYFISQVKLVQSQRNKEYSRNFK